MECGGYRNSMGIHWIPLDIRWPSRVRPWSTVDCLNSLPFYRVNFSSHFQQGRACNVAQIVDELNQGRYSDSLVRSISARSSHFVSGFEF